MKTLSLHFKTAADLARAAGVSREAARHWVSGKMQPTPEHVAAIDRATAGGVSAESLRPDLKWRRDKRGRIVSYTVTL
jgi:DNA-binding transcriptional regulator YdaS (Cro superfamily)